MSKFNPEHPRMCDCETCQHWQEIEFNSLGDKEEEDEEDVEYYRVRAADNFSGVFSYAFTKYS